MEIKQKIMMGLIMTSCALANAKNLSTYNELVTHLRAGIPVNAVIDVEKCHQSGDERDIWEEKTLGTRFDTIYERMAIDIEHGKKMRVVATSEHDYIGRESAHLIRSVYRVFEDGTTEVITQEINPVDYKVLKTTFLFCQLTSDNTSGVTLTAIEK